MTGFYRKTCLFDGCIEELLNKYKSSHEPINVNFRELVPQISQMDRYTHFIHAYPAKLLQQIPYFFLNNSVFSSEGDTVLDPFCGTGTVLLEASVANRNAIGIDVNPLAALISKIKTTKLDIDELKNVLDDIVIEFETYKKSKKRYHIPKISNLEYWYDSKTIRKLSKIKDIVSKIDNIDIKEFYQIVFSLCCKKFSYADPRISVPVRINKDKFIQGHPLYESAVKKMNYIKKNEVFEFFIEQANKNIKRLEEYIHSTKGNSVKVKVINADLKNFDTSLIEKENIQLILTSPPYVSAQKYIRASSLSLQWLELSNYTIAELDKKSIGRERFPISQYEELHLLGFENVDSVLSKIYQKNKLRAYITYAYLVEMQKLIAIFYNLLKNDSYLIMVIGNNKIAGYEFFTHRYLQEIAENIGFQTNLILIDDIKSRGLMTKRNKTASMISREYILVFRKR